MDRLTNCPRWSTLTGGEVGIGDAARLGGAAFGGPPSASSAAGVGLVIDVGPQGLPLVLMMTGPQRGRSAPVWPAYLLQPLLDRWQTRSGESVRIGDYVALAIKGYGRDPLGRIVSVGTVGNPIVWLASGDTGHEVHVDAADLLVRVER
jgi:hypothetical protein